MAGKQIIIPEAYAPDSRYKIGDAKVRQQMFAGGELGFWFDIWDINSLFQDAAGTTSVTASGQAVGLVKDKSGNGMNMQQATSGARPTYQTAGGLHWLEFADGNFMQIPRSMGEAKRSLVAGVRIDGGDGRKTLIEAYGHSAAYVNLSIDISDAAGDSGYWKTNHPVSGPPTSPDLYVLGTDEIVSNRFDWVDDSTPAAQNLDINGTTVASGIYDPDDVTITVDGYNVFVNRDETRQATGRLYGMAYVQAYVDLTDATALLAQRSGVTLV